MAQNIYGRTRVGIRVPSGGAPSYDSDAQAFFTAASITDPTQMGAVNTLVTGLKSNNLWTKMKAIYPVVGGNATAHSYNLKNTSQFQLSFSSGWTHSANGMTPNGTSAYANTGINPSSVLSSTSGNVGVYLRTNSSGTKLDFGVNYGSNKFYLAPNWNGGTGYASYASEFSFAATITTGLYSIGRLSSFDSNVKLIRNGSSILYNDNPSFINLPNGNLYLGASNENGSAAYFSNKEISLSYISDGLTPTQVNNLYTLVQAFQTTLGRQV
jgi:hypothetical protein